MSASRPGRFETAHFEPRYIALLEAERANWWKPEQFDTWKNLYVSEYARGFELLERLRRHVPGWSVTGARCLDVGCGDAGLLIALARAGAECTGLEPNERSRTRAAVRSEEHRVSVTIRAGRAESLPFTDASMDLVIADNLLEHVDDLAGSVRELSRVLRPGGLLYAVVPKRFALWSLWSDPHYELAGLVLLPGPLQRLYFERLRGGGKYEVGVLPTRRTLLRLFERTGLQLVVSPRVLWAEYVQSRVARPDEVRGTLKRQLARFLANQPGAFQKPAAQVAWDVALGSHLLLARKT